jgi:hypothetical protein
VDYYDNELTVYGLIRDLFVASSVTCFLWALHRIADGLVVSGRVAAYQEMAEAYTPEEREQLIHKVKRESLKF